MASWVIDENIFEIAADTSNKECLNAIYLTETISRYHKVVLDHENLLIGKYRRFFDSSKLLRIWFAKLQQHVGRTELRSSRVSNAISNHLDSIGFDPDDKCYVGVALNANKLIVSEDSDFRKPPSVATYLTSNLALEILTIEEANNSEATRRS